MYHIKLDRPEITKLAYHRNGVCGEGFHVALAQYEGRTMLVVTFDAEPDAVRTAAFDVSLVAEGIIGMFEGEGNAWRGDHFHDAMLQAIEQRTERDRFSELLVEPQADIPRQSEDEDAFALQMANLCM